MRFHSEDYLDYYLNSFPGSKIYIFTSSPKYKFIKKNFNHIFIPFFFKILFRLFGLTEPQYLKRIDQKIFMNISNIILRIINPDLIHSWGGISQKIFFTHCNSIKILERSSTYLPLQLEIIKNELRKYKINKFNNEFEIKEFKKELKNCDYVFVPSKYVKKNYPESIKKKLIVIYPFSSKLFNNIYKKNNKNKKIVGYVGSNIFVKGLFHLIENFFKSKISNEYILWLKIDNKDLNLLEIKTKNFILNNPKIIICGTNMSMKYFYSSINLLIQPSIDDGFNMVTIESLSAGVPTFVNNNMGSCEFLIKLLPNNKFNLKMKKDSLLLKLNSINQKNLNTQSNHLKNNFKKV